MIAFYDKNDKHMTRRSEAIVWFASDTNIFFIA